MGETKTEFKNRWLAAVFLGFLVMGGCGGKALKYSNITRANIQELKSYQWAKADGFYRQDPLLEANVQFQADLDLEQKGLIKRTEKADLLIWISYEYDHESSGNKLRMLALNIARADNNELIWRGTAVGDIRTNVSTGDLKKAIEGILANLPKK